MGKVEDIMKKVDELEAADDRRSEFTELLSFEWVDSPPKEDGEFFYSGKLPSGMEYVGIIHVVTDLNDVEKRRVACVFIPPFWRGNKERLQPTVEHGPLQKWKGQWSGPEHGLTCVEIR